MSAANHVNGGNNIERKSTALSTQQASIMIIIILAQKKTNYNCAHIFKLNHFENCLIFQQVSKHVHHNSNFYWISFQMLFMFFMLCTCQTFHFSHKTFCSSFSTVSILIVDVRCVWVTTNHYFLFKCHSYAATAFKYKFCIFFCLLFCKVYTLVFIIFWKTKRMIYLFVSRRIVSKLVWKSKKLTCTAYVHFEVAPLCFY